MDAVEAEGRRRQTHHAGDLTRNAHPVTPRDCPVTVAVKVVMRRNIMDASRVHSYTTATVTRARIVPRIFDVNQAWLSWLVSIGTAVSKTYHEVASAMAVFTCLT